MTLKLYCSANILIDAGSLQALGSAAFGLITCT